MTNPDPDQPSRVEENSIAFTKKIAELCTAYILENKGRDYAEVMAEISSGTLSASIALTSLSTMPEVYAGASYMEGVRIAKQTPMAEIMGDEFAAVFAEYDRIAKEAAVKDQPTPETWGLTN